MKPARTQSREEDEVSKLEKKKKNNAGEIIKSKASRFQLINTSTPALLAVSQSRFDCDWSIRRHNPDAL